MQLSIEDIAPFSSDLTGLRRALAMWYWLSRACVCVEDSGSFCCAATTINYELHKGDSQFFSSQNKVDSHCIVKGLALIQKRCAEQGS